MRPVPSPCQRDVLNLLTSIRYYWFHLRQRLGVAIDRSTLPLDPHIVFSESIRQSTRSGTTIAGLRDAAGNIDRYMADVVRPTRLKVKLDINLSMVGESTEAGCFSDPAWILTHVSML